MIQGTHEPARPRKWALRLLGGCLAIGLGALPLVGHGEVPSSDDLPMTIPMAAAPVVSPAPAPSVPADGGGGYRGGLGGGRWLGGRMMPPGSWTLAEWDDTAVFLKDHSPKRLEVINALEEGPRKFRIKSFFINTYRNVQRLKKDDAELSQAMTQRVELEDAVFGLVGQFREAKRRSDGTRQASLRREMAERVNELIDTNISERQLRIVRLERTLKQERDRLDTDKKSRDQLVQKRVNNLLDGQRQTDDDRSQTPEIPIRQELGMGPAGADEAEHATAAIKRD